MRCCAIMLPAVQASRSVCVCNFHRRNSQSTPDVAAASSGRVLAVDIEKDEDGYTLTADVPGLTKEDLKVRFTAQ